MWTNSGTGIVNVVKKADIPKYKHSTHSEKIEELDIGTVNVEKVDKPETRRLRYRHKLGTNIANAANAAKKL